MSKAAKRLHHMAEGRYQLIIDLLDWLWNQDSEAVIDFARDLLEDELKEAKP